jgi:zinc ribbon protein
MIVWGRSISHKVVATGQFYCPGCRQQRTYALRQHQKWGTIYWIPIVPLEKSEPYVECTSCHRTYPEAALRHDAASAQQHFNAQRALEDDLTQMICEVMALMAGEKHSVSPRLCGLIANAIRRLLQIEMSYDDILAAIAAAPDEPEAVLRNVERQTVSLTDRGRDIVLRAAVVAARKPLTESSGALAIEIGRQLGMKPEAIYATVAEFSAR